jgi:hypothetical protein
MVPALSTRARHEYSAAVINDDLAVRADSVQREWIVDHIRIL